jgi:hypothetical protein
MNLFLLITNEISNFVFFEFKCQKVFKSNKVKRSESGVQFCFFILSRRFKNVNLIWMNVNRHGTFFFKILFSKPSWRLFSYKRNKFLKFSLITSNSISLGSVSKTKQLENNIWTLKLWNWSNQKEFIHRWCRRYLN